MSVWDFIEYLYEYIMGNSISPAILEKKHVAIIGGGYGGIALASELKKYKIPFTLIDPKDCFHHNVAACRASVFPEEWNAKSLIEYKKAFGDQFLQGHVTKVDLETRKIFVNDNFALDFTDVVIAVGSDGPFPGVAKGFTLEDIKTEYKNLSDTIEKSDEIVIVGGGPVGVEIAGEIVERYKTKKIYLIHSGNQLITTEFGDKFQKNLLSLLDDADVEVVLNDKVTNLNELKTGIFETQTIKTQEGKNIRCNLVLKCIGSRPNLTLTQSIFDSETFDENNRLIVNEVLQIKGYSNVYGIGDCVNTKEFKMAAHAEQHGLLIAENMIRSMKDKTLKPYKTAFEGMVVSFGSNGGAGNFNGWNLPSFAVGLLKSKTLFTSKYWKMMGQEMPNK